MIHEGRAYQIDNSVNRYQALYWVGTLHDMEIVPASEVAGMFLPRTSVYFQGLPRYPKARSGK